MNHPGRESQLTPSCNPYLSAYGVAPGAVTLHEQLEVLERARHGPDRLRRHAGVERGRVELGMAEQDLDDANVHVLFEQVGGEAVAQRVGRHALLDPGGLGRLVDGAVELAR